MTRLVIAALGAALMSGPALAQLSGSSAGSGSGSSSSSTRSSAATSSAAVSTAGSARGATNSTAVNSGTRGNGAILVPGGASRSTPLQTQASGASSSQGNGRVSPGNDPADLAEAYPGTASSGILTGRQTR